ncbi:9805_t:CDS:2 [Funneliformis geosporum]|uniref:DNA-directed DNA polymerase n=1 Tax=Funneliformis geosporum TaxID=1117311 RepID=A0A9W4WQM2_9GLOM|nr:9805_t:CDS:2 [Funneliformis geosporum]
MSEDESVSDDLLISETFEDYFSLKYEPYQDEEEEITINYQFAWILLWLNIPETATESLIKFMKLILTEISDNKFNRFSSLTPDPYLYQIPEPGEWFEYVVVENNSSKRVGDKMEYPEVVRQLSKKINISYYLNSVVNLCARFINYDKLFQLSSEIVLEVLKRLKDDSRVKLMI